MPEKYVPFLYLVNLAKEECRLVLDRVLCGWISELIRKSSIFLATNSASDNMYWEQRGRVPNSLNSPRQDVLLLELVTTLIASFCDYICTVSVTCWCFDTIKMTCDIGDYHSGVTEGDVTSFPCACSSRRFERSYCPHPDVKHSKGRKLWSFQTSTTADPVTRGHIFVNMRVRSAAVIGWSR
jgi:hypothetical protein